MKFLANIHINYPKTYKKIPDFYRLNCSKVSFNKLFKKIKIKGFDCKKSFFIIPESKRLLSLFNYFVILQNKEKDEIFSLNALVINNRLINIYKTFFVDLFKEQKKVLYILHFSLSCLLNNIIIFNIKILYLIQVYIRNLKIN